MECYYHPNRESTDNCAICGKSICKECGLEIAGKTYCKDCLEKIVGLGIENKSTEPVQQETANNYVAQEPTRLEKTPIADTIYESQREEIPYTPRGDIPNQEIRQIKEDSPYNIHYSDNIEPQYPSHNEVAPQIQREEPVISQQPQNAQNEYDIYPEHTLQRENNQQEYIYPEHTLQRENNQQEYIYPDHSFDSPKSNLEDKYERYLDDLYFDDNELPLDEQLAKDEEEYGSLTRRPYHPRSEEALLREEAAQRPKRETPEEMEARIRAEILAEKEKKSGIRNSNIHNLNYKEEKEPMNIVDILLTIILIIVILIVLYYVIYIFLLTAAYPTFMDAIYGLTNPQNLINNLLNH